MRLEQRALRHQASGEIQPTLRTSHSGGGSSSSNQPQPPAAAAAAADAMDDDMSGFNTLPLYDTMPSGSAGTDIRSSVQEMQQAAREEEEAILLMQHANGITRGGPDGLGSRSGSNPMLQRRETADSGVTEVMQRRSQRCRICGGRALSSLKRIRGGRHRRMATRMMTRRVELSARHGLTAAFRFHLFA